MRLEIQSVLIKHRDDNLRHLRDNQLKLHVQGLTSIYTFQYIYIPFLKFSKVFDSNQYIYPRKIESQEIILAFSECFYLRKLFENDIQTPGNPKIFACGAIVSLEVIKICIK